MRIALFCAVLFGLISANFVYQAVRFEPEWSVALERSWFQLIALAALGTTWAIASINHQL